MKVEEGQRINVGDIISDRTAERTKLQAKKQRLEASLTRAKLPLRELKAVPAPTFQTELAALKQAQFQLESIVQQTNNFDQKFYHKDPWHVQVFESDLTFPVKSTNDEIARSLSSLEFSIIQFQDNQRRKNRTSIQGKLSDLSIKKITGKVRSQTRFNDWQTSSVRN